MTDTLADRLSQARTLRGFSRKALSQAAGLSGSHVGQIESGRLEDPRTSTLEKLAVALNVRIEWLAHGVGPSPVRKAS